MRRREKHLFHGVCWCVYRLLSSLTQIGTGKSVLLREIIKGLRKKFINSPDAVAVTASTGIAACNIGGVTLHSFGGVGLGIEKTDVLVGKIRKNKKAQARWTRTKVLIIDEGESRGDYSTAKASLHGRRRSV